MQKKTTDSQAPYEYIQDYYEARIKRRCKFIGAREFYEQQLKHVSGDKIINIGCGPQLYDDLRYFSGSPIEYMGLDVNLQNFEFMKNSSNQFLLEGKRLALDNSVNVKSICGSIFDSSIREISELSNVDCVLSVGFLGIFEEEKFKKAVCRIFNWLKNGGKFVNLSWCGNLQHRQLLQKRLQYQFNNKDNTDHDNIIKFTEEIGLRMTHKKLFDVPNKEEYGWSAISASVFEKIDSSTITN